MEEREVATDALSPDRVPIEAMHRLAYEGLDLTYVTCLADVLAV